MHIFFSGFEAVVLALVLSLDAFVVSFAYGADKIKIPTVSVLIINVLCSFILGVSMLNSSFRSGWKLPFPSPFYFFWGLPRFLTVLQKL